MNRGIGERSRKPAVAGSFYPDRRSDLEDVVDGHLGAANPPDSDVGPRMLIVPHAGYVYSGPVAATAYRLLQSVQPVRLVVLGPSHFVGFRGLAAPDVDFFETPLGRVSIDAPLRKRAAAHDGVAIDYGPHRREHSLEVQLPFVQRVLDDFTVLPLLTGDADPEPAVAVLDELLDDGVFALISSDLSHYLAYEVARRRDARTAEAIVGLRAEDIGSEDACGRTAVRAGLMLARRRDWVCRLLDLRSSGDTAGSRDRVVGYGSFVIGEPSG